MAEGVFSGFMKGQAATQARQQFPLEQQLSQLRNQQVQQGLEQSAAEFPLQQQLLQQRIAQQQAAFPIQQQLDQLRIQEGRLGLREGKQRIVEAKRKQKAEDVITLGNIADRAKFIDDPEERLGYMQSLVAEANLDANISPGDEDLQTIQRLIDARDSLAQRDASLSGRKLTANEKDWERYQELKKTDPEGAKQYGIASGFLTKEGEELSVHLQKRLSSATDAAQEARSNSVEFRSLADQFENSEVTGGILSKWADSLKSFTGNQDAISALRKRYFGVRASQVIKNLPPGAASDVDVRNAMRAFPEDTANGKQIASFLRGLAKMEDAADQFNTFKAEYISNPKNRGERGLLKAWREQVGLDGSSKQTVGGQDLSKLSDEELLRQIQALEGNQ